jgi:putative ABC transport system permease protein
MKRSLRSWLWRVPVDAEVDEELAFHVEMRTRELVARGVDPDTARAMAIARIGNLGQLKDTCVTLGKRRDRDMRLGQWIREFGADVRFALRQLRAAPGFAFIAVATLALGIGANSAIFALVDVTLLRPLPFRDPDRIVSVWERSDAAPRSRVSSPNMLDWNDRSSTFELLAGYRRFVGAMVLAGDSGIGESVTRQWVTGGFFEVLGVTPVAGRTFTAADDRNPADAVVISEAFWRSRFGGDPSLIGRTLRLDGEPYTVLGVAPRSFEWAGNTSIWALSPASRAPAARAGYGLDVIGRMKPGITIEAAQDDLRRVAAGLAAEFPATNKGRSVGLEPLQTTLIGSELRTTSMLFLGVVGFVLLICCANVANLLLARATVRSRELAIRSALGAGRQRMIRQLLTESLVLSALGGVLGIAIGWTILGLAPSVLPADLLPGPLALTFNVRVAAFCGLAALTVGVLFGLAPAWQATSAASPQMVGSDTRTTTGRGGRLRGVLVIVEVATAVLLLTGAGLLLRTLFAVEGVDRGYRAPSVLAMLVDPLGSKYPTPESLLQFFDDVERETLAVAGVGRVAWTSGLPLGGGSFDRSFEIVGDPPVEKHLRPVADNQVVSAGYFEALDLPILAGRAFNRFDTRQSPPICIVNEAFVRNHLGGRSPIGVRVALRSANAPDAPPQIREIVGVARQVMRQPDEKSDFVQLYTPMTQNLSDDIYMVVRPSSGRAEVLAGAVRTAIGRVDKEQLVGVREIMTLDDVASLAAGRHRFRALMVMLFAGLALVLAMVGVFGILAYSVQQRTRDFAVRRALGATTGDVLRLVVESATRVVGAGIVIGLILSAALTRLLTTVLVGVRPSDPLTFAGVGMMLLITATAAIAWPAWRAARIDPAAALRAR